MQLCDDHETNDGLLKKKGKIMRQYASLRSLWTVSIGLFLLFFNTQALAELQVSVGDMFGAAPDMVVIDPVTGTAVGQGALVMLVYDTDEDGSQDDIDMSDGTPINQDIEIGRFEIGEGGFPPFDTGGGSHYFSYADLNAAVDVVPGLNGDTGRFYLRVFNVADPSEGGEIRWGDSIDANPNIVVPNSFEFGGGLIYTETPPEEPRIFTWNVGGVVLDQKPAGDTEPPGDLCQVARYASLSSDFLFVNRSQSDAYADQWLGGFEFTITEDLLDNLQLFNDQYEVRPFSLLEEKGGLLVRAPGPDVPDGERYAKLRYFGLATNPEGAAMRLTFISTPPGFEQSLTVSLEATFNDETPYTLDQLQSMQTIAALFDSGINDLTMSSYLLSGVNGNNEIGNTLPIDVIRETSSSDDNVVPADGAELSADYTLVTLGEVEGVPDVFTVMETFSSDIKVGADADFLNFGNFLLVNGVEVGMTFRDENEFEYPIDAIERIIMVQDGLYPVAYVYGYADPAELLFPNDYVIIVMKITFEIDALVAEITDVEDLCAVFSAQWENTTLSLQTESSFIGDISATAAIEGGCAQTEPLQYTLVQAGWHSLNFFQLPDDFRASVGSLENVSFRVDGEEVPFGEDLTAFYFQTTNTNATVCVLPYRENPEPRSVPGFPVNGLTAYVDRSIDNQCVWQSNLAPAGTPRNLLINQSPIPDLAFNAEGLLIDGGYDWMNYRYISATSDITLVRQDPSCMISVVYGPLPLPLPPLPPLPIP